MAPPSRTTATTAGPDPGMRGGNPRRARGAAAGGGGFAGRAAGWAALGGSADTEPSTRGPAPAGETSPAAQAASPAALPPEGAPGAQGDETTAPASRAAAPTTAPGTPPARGVAPARAPGRLAGSCRSRSRRQGGREVLRPNQPQPHPHQTPQAVPPKGRLPYGTAAACPPPGA